MLGTVKFNDQFCFVAIKIRNIVTNYPLTAKGNR